MCIYVHTDIQFIELNLINYDLWVEILTVVDTGECKLPRF